MNVGLINCADEPEQMAFLFQLLPIFQKFGINFARSNIDILLMRHDATQAAFGKKCLDSGAPVIILERMDASALASETRALIEHENVVAVFKNRILRQATLYNYPVSEFSYHGKLLNDYVKTAETISHEPRLSDKALAKIKLVLWDIDGSYIQKKFESEKNIWNDYPQFLKASKNRDIDVILLGTFSGYSSDLLNWHRAMIVEQVNALSKRGLRVLVGGRDVPDYAALMRRSKVAVSPWGHGEWCFRDVEAFYFGAALAKPNTDFVLTYPDLFHDDLYYRFAPDASDLSSAVFAAIQEFEGKAPQRFEIRRQMVETMNVEWLVAKMANAIFDAYASR